MTLFHPATGAVRLEGVTSCPNSVLHPWLQHELSEILADQSKAVSTKVSSRRAWERWQAGLKIRITLPEQLPPLWMLSVLDNLAGHKTSAFVLWLFAHGIMPLYTPLFWLMAEYGRKHPTGSQTPGNGRTESIPSRRNHVLV